VERQDVEQPLVWIGVSGLDPRDLVGGGLPVG
jgi:hypothetical protein